jgi:hypothetical protein
MPEATITRRAPAKVPEITAAFRLQKLLSIGQAVAAVAVSTRLAPEPD